MTDVEGEFCWVAEFCELEAADREQVAISQPAIDLSTPKIVEPTLSLRSPQFATGPVEIAQLEAVGHFGSRASETAVVGTSTGAGLKLKPRKQSIFAVGVGVLAACAVAIAAVGFRLNTGSLETESAGPLTTASTFSQSNETDGSDTNPDDSTSSTDSLSVETSPGRDDAAAEPISSDSFERPRTTTETARASTGGGDARPSTITNSRPATTVRSSLVQTSGRRSPTITSPRRAEQVSSPGRATSNASPTTTTATSGEDPVPSRSNTTEATDRIASPLLPSGTSPSPAPSTTTSSIATASTTTSSSNNTTTTVRLGNDDTIDPQPGQVLQVGLEPPLDRVGYGAAALTADTGNLDFLASDKIANAEGEGSAGVVVDVFTATPAGLRDKFVSSDETEADGVYRVAIPNGEGDNDGCYVMVFVAPQGVGFEASGQFREVQLCAPFEAEDLPIVRTVDLGSDVEVDESTRSIVVTGRPMYLKGSVSTEERATELADRFQGLPNSTVLADYQIVANTVDKIGTDGVGVVETDLDGRSDVGDQDRIYFKGGSQNLFATNSADPTETLERLVADLVAILDRHNQAQLRVIVGADAALGETEVTKQMLTDRAEKVVALFQDGEIASDRLEASYTTGRLSGRHLYGESMSNQVEFVLIWD